MVVHDDRTGGKGAKAGIRVRPLDRVVAVRRRPACSGVIKSATAQVVKNDVPARGHEEHVRSGLQRIIDRLDCDKGGAGRGHTSGIPHYERTRIEENRAGLAVDGIGIGGSVEMQESPAGNLYKTAVSRGSP